MKSASIETNRARFERSYAGGARRRHPDLMFVHYLHRYVLGDITIDRALVVGAGDGPEVFALVDLGAYVTAVDSAPKAVARVAHFAADDGVADRIDARIGDQRDLGVEVSSYDLAVSWSVISYLEPAEGARAVSEIFRALRPGGHFIGLLESTEHSSPTLPGAERIGAATWRIPENAPTLGGVVMTYYDRAAVETALCGFTDLSLAHRVLSLPPDASHRVGQWMFHARKEG